MSTDTFSELDELQQASGPAATIDKLIELLQGQKEYHRLFDALLLKKKIELGTHSTQPTSFDDIAEDKRDEFEKFYIDTARAIGQMFLDDGQIPQAWVYFRTIQEPEKITAAIEELPVPTDFDDQTEELLNIALYEGANPCKGFQIMLRLHGICSTITAVDQMLGQLKEHDRKEVAKLLVNELYGDLCRTLQNEVSQKIELPEPLETIGELIAGRDWIFEENNYHIDVSHLSSVVRFARALEADDAEMQKVIELCEYGSRLAEQFQYAGDPPFQNYYPAHLHFFKALSGKNTDEALAHFKNELEQEPDEQDKQLIAYVLVDLMKRIDRMDEAFELAETYLQTLEDPNGFSFSEMCRKAGRLDTLRKVAREKGDLVGYAAALIAESGTA